MKLLKPPKLQIGDTIGVVAPCLPLLPDFRESYGLGIKQLEKLGFKVKEGKTLSLKHWWSGGTPMEQAADINAMFQDPEVKALVAASGGYTAIGVLEELDYKMIAQHPKPFLGMSDMTGYHLALLTKTNLVGFHMDEVCFGMGMNWQKAESGRRAQAEEMFIKFLTKNHSPGLIPAMRERQTWRAGSAAGRLIGGNISSLTRLIGTPYFPPLEWFDGAILFREAVGLHGYDIYQMLYQLKYHGIFDRITGMLVGTISATKPAQTPGLDEPKIKEVAMEVLKDFNFPILAGMDFGHFTVNLPMPIGLEVSMEADNQTLEFLEPAVV